MFQDSRMEKAFMEHHPSELEVFKPAPVHFCTDFTSTANATVSTYSRDVPPLGTFLQAVKLVQDSHLLNTHPHPQPTRATLPSRHSFAGKYRTGTRNENDFCLAKVLFCDSKSEFSCQITG
ncbi:hypothetical protein RF11_12119 [Thelohanellus kitauei]|uniref:Uncharacterized protein n=1 Tax=Thelohanellus kitauei TaxID=669202 RepID=A0A0C2J3J9_THEKT|nr:hypothetical protein RF11_12119 [Thelohanellus kitauei]